jgi:hypothetical protein
LFHSLVALEDEELEAEAGAAFLHHVGGPGAEVLDAPDLDFLGVDIDPVVGEAVFLRHHERDGEEVPVAEIVRARSTGGGAGDPSP